MIYDIIIIGGGINGIIALEFFINLKKNVLLIEKSNTLLSFLNNYMYDDLEFISEGKKINMKKDIVSVKHLKEIFICKSNNYISNIKLNEECTIINHKKDYIMLNTDCNTYNCKNIILAIGRSEPKPFYNLKNITRKIDKYSDKKILLIGSGDSTGDFILANYDKNKIIWVNKYYNNPSQIFHKKIKSKYQSIKKDNIDILNHNNIKYENDNIYYNNKKIEYDICTCLIGFNMNNEFINNNKLKLIYTEKDFLQINSNYETSLKNVYAIGEIVTNPLNFSTRAYIEHTNEILKRMNIK